MKKALKKDSANQLFHFVDGKRVDEKNENMSGDCTGLYGDCTGLYGNFDDCEITEEERAAGVRIEDLIEEFQGQL
jgi:hypothetical protein